MSISKFVSSYVVGGKSSEPLPVEVTLKLDPDFKRSLLTATSILGVSIAVGVAVGVAASKRR